MARAKCENSNNTVLVKIVQKDFTTLCLVSKFNENDSGGNISERKKTNL